MTISREMLTAIVVLIAGAVFFVLAQALRFGSAASMGPGYLPKTLSVIIIVLGILMLARALFSRSVAKPDWVALRPFLIVLICPLLFAFAITRLGLVLTIVLVASFSRLAVPQRLGYEALITPLVLAVGCSVLFVYLLGTPLPLWPTVLR